MQPTCRPVSQGLQQLSELQLLQRLEHIVSADGLALQAAAKAAPGLQWWQRLQAGSTY